MESEPMLSSNEVQVIQEQFRDTYRAAIFAVEAQQQLRERAERTFRFDPRVAATAEHAGRVARARLIWESTRKIVDEIPVLGKGDALAEVAYAMEELIGMVYASAAATEKGDVSELAREGYWLSFPPDGEDEHELLANRVSVLLRDLGASVPADGDMGLSR